MELPFVLEEIDNKTYPLYYKDNFVKNLDYPDFLKFRAELKKFCNGDNKNPEPRNFYMLCEAKKVTFDYKGECSDTTAFDYIISLLVKLI